MTKTKAKPTGGGSGVFLPGVDLSDYLEQRGDLRAVFDQVHAHFFENFGGSDFLNESPHRVPERRPRAKGESHAQGRPR